ncbi:MAG: hypothetical protein HPY90_01435 [Syntrophothermus sp.]|uniref:hypothetical protein n=1 Tax=Syntrophothermus sp. TaxID=2736299 RepID=UPI002579977A|nr:hypothetical protein [Syntrophothermus sp.]NSW81926.1 hypothetical protein [Syntrophothermus sp.]
MKKVKRTVAVLALSSFIFGSAPAALASTSTPVQPTKPATKVVSVAKQKAHASPVAAAAKALATTKAKAKKAVKDRHKIVKVKAKKAVKPVKK